MKATVVMAAGKVREIWVDPGRDLVREVVGGFAEWAKWGHRDRVGVMRTVGMWVNEDGKVRGLPVNRLATALATWGAGRVLPYCLYGDVVVCGVDPVSLEPVNIAPETHAAIMEILMAQVLLGWDAGDVPGTPE